VTDAIVVQVCQLFHSLHQAILTRMIEPTRADGHIHLGRQPSLTVAAALLQGLCIVKRFEISFIHTPLRGICLAFLVTDPAQSGHRATEDGCFRAILPNDLPGLLVVIVFLCHNRAHLICTAVPSCAAVGTVEPELEQRSVVTHKFLNLLVIDVYITLIAIFRLVAVPRREIQPELQAMFLTGVTQLTYQIAFPIFKIGVFDGILSGPSRPKTESVVVLGSKDHAFHADGFQGQNPLLAVQI